MVGFGIVCTQYSYQLIPGVLLIIRIGRVGTYLAKIPSREVPIPQAYLYSYEYVEQ